VVSAVEYKLDPHELDAKEAAAQVVQKKLNLNFCHSVFRQRTADFVDEYTGENLFHLYAK